MKHLKRSISVLLALLMLAALAACAPRQGNGPQPTEAPDAAGLTEEQSRRIIELAAAFDEFGEFSLDKGLELASAERMIYCYYRGLLPESELKGFGRVTVEEGLAALAGVFKGMQVPEILRTKYNAAEEQELFILNGFYYIRLPEGQDKQFELRRVEPINGEPEASSGKKDDKAGEGIEPTLRAFVDVKAGGKLEKVIVLDLMPNEEWQFSAAGCGFQFAD